MSKISCNVIKDILPLYVDDVVSEDTKSVVEEHLETCTACKAEMEAMVENIAIPIAGDCNKEEGEFINRIKKTFRKKKIWISLVSATLTVAMAFGLYCYMRIPTELMPYEEAPIEIVEYDGNIYSVCKGKEFESVSVCQSESIYEDGREKYDVLIFYEKSFWSEYVKPRLDTSNEPHIFQLNSYSEYYNEKGELIKEKATIGTIYYSNKKFDARRSGKTPWEDLTADAQIIWQAE